MKITRNSDFEELQRFGQKDRLVIKHHKGKEYGGNFVVRPVPPTWRDFWAILRGTYQPRLTITQAPTVEQTARIIKETYVGPANEFLNSRGTFLSRLDS